jgi:hypothetical protein
MANGEKKAAIIGKTLSVPPSETLPSSLFIWLIMGSSCWIRRLPIQRLKIPGKGL